MEKSITSQATYHCLQCKCVAVHRRHQDIHVAVAVKVFDKRHRICLLTNINPVRAARPRGDNINKPVKTAPRNSPYSAEKWSKTVKISSKNGRKTVEVFLDRTSARSAEACHSLRPRRSPNPPCVKILQIQAKFRPKQG